MEEPVISLSDDCKCKQQVSAVTDLLKKFIITERDTENSKPEATSGKNTKFNLKTQTEGNSRQRDNANTDEQKSVRTLQHKNRKLSVLVEKYKRKTVLLNEEMEHMLRDGTSHIHHVRKRYEEENQRLVLKMRDTRDELLWYKEQAPVAHNSGD
jgi:glutamate synthase domain-containing protein 2